jgi:hypothetical protein
MQSFEKCVTPGEELGWSYLDQRVREDIIRDCTGGPAAWRVPLYRDNVPCNNLEKLVKIVVFLPMILVGAMRVHCGVWASAGAPCARNALVVHLQPIVGW